MTSSRSNAGVLICGILLSAAILASGPAAAQQKPQSLVPFLQPDKTDSSGGQAPSGTEPAAPGAESPLKAKQPLTLEGGELKGSVIVQTLGRLDIASIGTLNSSTGGLGPDMWQGTKPARIMTVLKMLPVANSPAMQSLSRRLLLTAAAIPQGGEKPTELLRLRFEKLREAGLVTDAAALINRLPASSMTPDLERIAVELLLLQGKNAEACKQVDSASPAAKGHFWEKAGIFCALIAGDMAKAELGISLLGEEESGDSLFFSLFDRLDGGKAPLPDNDNALTPLQFAMMSMAGLQVPYTKAEKAGYDFLWALAMQKTASKDSRLEAAYASLGVDSLPADLSRQLIDNGALQGEDDGSVDLRHMAALFRQASSEKDPDVRARLLAQIWSAGDQDGSYLAAGRLALPLLRGLEPKAEDGDFGLDALGLLLMAGDDANATAWERAIRRAALHGSDAERQVAVQRIARADAYMLISGVPGIARWNPNEFDGAVFVKGAGPERTENLGFVLAMLSALGEEVPDRLWQEALDSGQVPQTGFSNAVIAENLSLAADAGRVGETVALSLAAIGDGGPASVTVETLALVIRSLQKVGLNKEARHLALEAAILRNL